MNNLSLVRPNLLTHHALGMPIACMFSAGKCLRICYGEANWKTPTMIINAVGAAALATLSVLFAISTSEVLVGTFAFASQATLFPWFLVTVVVINVAQYAANTSKPENKIDLASIAVIAVLALLFNGLD